MKILIKNDRKSKLYSGQMNFEAFKSFINTKIEAKDPKISFYDEEGDKIVIITKEDFDVMLTLCEDKEYVKVEVENEDSKENQIEIKEEAKPQDKKKDSPKKSQGKGHPKHNKSGNDKSENKHHGKSGRKGPKQPKDHKKRQGDECSPMRDHHFGHPLRGCFEQLCNLMNQRVSQIVDERLQALIPCIKTQLNNPTLKFDPSNLKHDNIQCKNCLIVPIVGIYYSCPVCPNFNLCEKCEVEIDHPHNLLKVKRIEEPKKPFDFWQFKQMQKHFFKRFMKGRDSSNSDMEGGKGRCHWRRRSCSPQKKIHIRCQKMSNIFGQEPEFYSAFVKKTLDNNMEENFNLYIQENNLDPKIIEERRCKKKLEKLSVFFQKPASNYQELVYTNPSKNFRELIQMLKEQGKQTYDGSNFKRMKET